MSEFLFAQIPSIFWGLAVFAIFVLIVYKGGITKVIAAVDARDKKIADQLTQAEEAHAKAQELQAQLDASLAGAEAQIAELIADARRDGEALKAKIEAEGVAEIDTMRNKALREIATTKAQAVIDVQQQVGEIAIEIAGKILKSELDKARHEQLVDDVVHQYEANSRRRHDGSERTACCRLALLLLTTLTAAMRFV